MEDVPVALPGGGNVPEETPEPSSPGGAGDAETPAPPPAAVMPTCVVAPTGGAEATYQIEGGSWVNGTLTEAFRAVSDGGTIKLLRDVNVNNNDNTALLLRDKAATLLGDGHSVCLERGSILVDGTGKLNLGREGESGTLIISSKDDPNCITVLRDNIPTAPRISNPSGITTSPGPSSIMGCCTVSLPPGGTRSGPRCSGTGRWPSGGNLPTGSMKTAPRCPTAAVWGTGSASVPSNLPVCLRDWNPCPWM